MDELMHSTTFPLLALLAASVFTFFWYLDSKTHTLLVQSDISDPELRTHRILILASGMMECSLILMYWLRCEALALFIAAFITRTAHEFIDELKFHVDRCTFRETLFHLIMWVSVLTKTFVLLIWGFFFHYEGVTNLPLWMYLWAALVVGCMGMISLKEWNQEKH